MDSSIAAWRDFYGAVANAAAALLGLVFVGLSLHLSLRKATAPVRSLALGSAITLLFPLLVALLMLMPVGAPELHASGSMLLAIILTIELTWVARMRLQDRGDTLLWLMYRLGIPFGACAVLFVGGIGLLARWEGAITAPAIFAFAMFVVGVQDAVDLLLGERGTRSSLPQGVWRIGPACRGRGSHPSKRASLHGDRSGDDRRRSGVPRRAERVGRQSGDTGPSGPPPESRKAVQPRASARRAS